MGYEFERLDYARNFWQRGKNGDKAHYHSKGENPHIKTYRPKNVVERIRRHDQKKLFDDEGDQG